MKTTIDLPPDLVREMKILAAHEGRKLKDVAADLLKGGSARGKRRLKVRRGGTFCYPHLSEHRQ